MPTRVLPMHNAAILPQTDSKQGIISNNRIGLHTSKLHLSEKLQHHHIFPILGTTIDVQERKFKSIPSHIQRNIATTSLTTPFQVSTDRNALHKPISIHPISSNTDFISETHDSNQIIRRQSHNHEPSKSPLAAKTLRNLFPLG